MPTTNNIVRFRKEDYKESPAWFDRVIYGLNLLIDYIFSLSTSIANNTASINNFPEFQLKQFNMTSSGTSTTNPETNTFSFNYTLTNDPTQLLIYATNTSIPIFTSPVWASWHFKNNVVFIDAITGLANNTLYSFNVTVIAQKD